MSSLPDTRLALINFVREHHDLPAGTTVAGGVGDDITAHLPWVACFQPPGPPPMMWARWDRATLHWQVWAATDQQARDVAAMVYDICHQAPGATITTPPTVVQSVTDMTGIGQLADPGLPDLGRFAFTLQVAARNA